MPPQTRRKARQTLFILLPFLSIFLGAEIVRNTYLIVMMASNGIHSGQKYGTSVVDTAVHVIDSNSLQITTMYPPIIHYKIVCISRCEKIPAPNMNKPLLFRSGMQDGTCSTRHVELPSGCVVCSGGASNPDGCGYHQMYRTKPAILQSPTSLNNLEPESTVAELRVAQNKRHQKAPSFTNSMV